MLAKKFWLPVCLLAVSLASANAQEAIDVDPIAPPAIDTAAVERARAYLEGSTDLPEPVRVAALESCGVATEKLAQSSKLAEKGAEFAAAVEGAAAAAAKARESKEKLGESPEPIDPAADLPTLVQELAKQELKLETQRKKVASLEAEVQTRGQRRKDIHTRLAEIAAESANEDAPEPAPASTPPAVADAEFFARTAQALALRQEETTLRSELAKYDAEDTADLLRLQIDLATRKSSLLDKTVQALKKAIERRREAAAEDLVRKARREAIVAFPALKSHADANHGLAETAQRVSHDLGQAEEALKDSSAAYQHLDKQMQSTRRKVETVGLTSAVGAYLRKQRLTLPGVAERVAAIDSRRNVIDEIEYLRLECEDARQELSDLDLCVEALVAEVRETTETDEAVLASAARDLLENKRGYLDSLRDACNAYFDTLIELDIKDKQVVELTEQYAEYIDERVLWIRSGKPLHKDFWPEPSDLAFASAPRWVGVATRLAGDARRRPAPYAVAVGLLVLSLGWGRAMRRRLRAAGEEAEKANCRGFKPTLDALATTTALASFGPLVAGFVAWRLMRLGDELGAALGQGLAALAVLWLVVNLCRQACRRKGLGESHFEWPASATQTVRRHAGWFAAVAAPAVFVTAALLALDTSHGSDALERVVFIAGMAWTAAVSAMHLGPGGVLREHMAYNKGGWVDRLRVVWPVLAAAPPLALAALAYMGYYYTAVVLVQCLFTTACVVGVAILVKELLLRMLRLRRRALSMEQAKARAAAAAAAAEHSLGDAAVAGIVAAEPQADLKAHSQQTRRLVNSGVLAASVLGIWFIWVPVLPALSMLDKIPLWTNATPVVVAAAESAPAVSPPGMPSPASTGATEVVAQRESVTTLSDLAVALLIVFLTFVLVRNGPGLLELAVLQQLPIDASVRYAVTTLVSYAIVLVGVIASCSTIGLEWSQVQWLATALTFGLAFGLQEMFANFVAGLIILLERPIRVGDVVTVDNIDGVVSKIRIRATSITNWDRKEYVVPNKEFITGRLLNWTLSDQVNRIVVNVGVAYGSDTDRAREILLAVANGHPLILKEPSAVATFEGFGDNSLNLVLRCYLPNLDNRLLTIHELHSAINKAFVAEGIEIAFPQRDLHIRSAPAALMSALQSEDSAVKNQRKGAA